MRSRVLIPAVLLAVSTVAACGTPPDHQTTPAPTTSASTQASDEDDEGLVSDNPSAAALPLPPPRPDGSCSTRFLPLPDPQCTPGATNPDVTQATIGKTICAAGWTKTIRPTTKYTNALKAQQLREYGYPKGISPDGFEEDHFLPLELGGNPVDPANLWPEPHAGSPNSYDKDKVETKVKAAVCRPGSPVPLASAQQAMLTDWTTALHNLGIG